MYELKKTREHIDKNEILISQSPKVYKVFKEKEKKYDSSSPTPKKFPLATKGWGRQYGRTFVELKICHRNNWLSQYLHWKSPTPSTRSSGTLSGKKT